MATNWTLKENSTGELIVTIEGDEWKVACDKAFKKIAKGLEVKGFRKGQVPAAIQKQKISPAQAQIQAVDDNASEWLRRGIEEHDLKLVSRPTLDIKNMDADHVELAFELAVEPEFELGQYKDLEYAVKPVEVTDDEFHNELNRLREAYADVQTKETEAENGDTVNIDYEGFKDGVPFEGGKAEGYDLVLGSNSFIPGFEEGLVGCKAGDEKELNLTFPENYHSEDLKGASVVFKVKVNEVKTKILPEVDDDFAKDVNAPGVETAAQLEELIRNNIKTGKSEQATQEAENKLAAKLAEGTVVEIPAAMIQAEAQNMVYELSQRISQYGMDIKQYLSMIGQSVEELTKSYEEEAKKNVKLRLILDKIAKTEDLKVAEDEIEKEFDTLSKMYNVELEKVKAQIDAELVKEDLLRQKAYEFVKSHVKEVEETVAEAAETVEGEEPAKKPAAKKTTAKKTTKKTAKKEEAEAADAEEAK